VVLLLKLVLLALFRQFLLFDCYPSLSLDGLLFRFALPECIRPALGILVVSLKPPDILLELIEQAASRLLATVTAVFEAFGVGQRITLVDHRFFLTGAPSEQETRRSQRNCNRGSDCHMFLILSLKWFGRNQSAKPEAHAGLLFLCSNTSTLSARIPDAVSNSSRTTD